MSALLVLILMAQPIEQMPLPQSVTLLRQYENPKTKGYPIKLPGNVDFAKDGSLYLLDQGEGRILQWDKDGKFVRAFGKKGVEKGTMKNAITLAIGEEEIWVWARNQMMYTYDLQGELLREARFVGPFPKSLGVLKKDLLLMGSEIMLDGKFVFKMVLARPDTAMMELMSFDNPMLLAMEKKEKSEKMTVRAYGPDVDVQRDEKGVWYFGCGAEPILFTVTNDGNINGQVELELEDEMVTKEEIAWLEKADFPVWSGYRISLIDDQTDLNYKDPKAKFTQFTIKDGKGIFALTATGGYITDLYAPNSQATYRVVDLATGKVTAKGSYAFSTDSKVFYRNGRIVAAITDPTGNFQVADITLKGW